MSDDALSEDDDADAVYPVRQAPKNVSKRAAAREARGGTRRSPAFIIPTPLNYKSDGAGVVFSSIVCRMTSASTSGVSSTSMTP